MAITSLYEIKLMRHHLSLFLILSFCILHYLVPPCLHRTTHKFTQKKFTLKKQELADQAKRIDEQQAKEKRGILPSSVWKAINLDKSKEREKDKEREKQREKDKEKEKDRERAKEKEKRKEEEKKERREDKKKERRDRDRDRKERDYSSKRKSRKEKDSLLSPGRRGKNLVKGLSNSSSAIESDVPDMVQRRESENTVLKSLSFRAISRENDPLRRRHSVDAHDTSRVLPLHLRSGGGGGGGAATLASVSPKREKGGKSQKRREKERRERKKHRHSGHRSRSGDNEPPSRSPTPASAVPVVTMSVDALHDNCVKREKGVRQIHSMALSGDVNSSGSGGASAPTLPFLNKSDSSASSTTLSDSASSSEGEESSDISSLMSTGDGDIVMAEVLQSDSDKDEKTTRGDALKTSLSSREGRDEKRKAGGRVKSAEMASTEWKRQKTKSSSTEELINDEELDNSSRRDGVDGRAGENGAVQALSFQKSETTSSLESSFASPRSSSMLKGVEKAELSIETLLAPGYPMLVVDPDIGERKPCYGLMEVRAFHSY